VSKLATSLPTSEGEEGRKRIWTSRPRRRSACGDGERLGHQLQRHLGVHDPAVAERQQRLGPALVQPPERLRVLA
jgi:hypothetical protein